MRPRLMLIKGDGPIPDLVVLSDEASQVFFGLGESCQELVKEGITRAYAKTVRHLVDMSLNPYSDLVKSVQLSALVGEYANFTMSGFLVRCRLDLTGPNLVFNVVNITPSVALSGYQVHEL
jgi:hypothetical protein